MAAEILVGDPIEDGKRYLSALRADNVSVTLVLWVKRSEDGEWRLYVVSPKDVGDEAKKLYQQVYAAYARLRDPGFSFLDVNIVPPTHPLAQEAAALRQRYAPSHPIRFQGSRLGDLAIDEAYIYPTANGTLTPAEATRRFLDLLSQPGAIPPSLVTLQDGSKIRVIPTAVRAQPGQSEVTLRDVQSGVERTVSASDIVQIE